MTAFGQKVSVATVRFEATGFRAFCPTITGGVRPTSAIKLIHGVALGAAIELPAHPKRTPSRQAATFIKGQLGGNAASQSVKYAVDSAHGWRIYIQRMPR